MATSPSSRSRVVPGSFRDPSGFVFLVDGEVYRQVNRRYQEEYDLLMSSGLYDALTSEGLLVRHQEVELALAQTGDAYRILKPDRIAFISYPYSWCFSQLKDAALLTLELQQRALAFGASLKDCSAFNIQFTDGRPILMDTLSFEAYREGEPWAAYRQFCQHFLAPLALAAYVDVRLLRLLRIHIDGIPLDLASSLLPKRTWCNMGLLMHLHLHGKAERRLAGQSVTLPLRGMNRVALMGVLDSLRATITKMKWSPRGDWQEYYDFSNYSAAALEDKKRIVSRMLDSIVPSPRMAWDLGANIGVFSRLTSTKGITTVSVDFDPGAVEINYREVKKKREPRILPLWLDLTNPSPSLGWENLERFSLLERGPVDLVLALALIHHLAISNNVPLARIAQFLNRLCKLLIIEFVPKQDSHVQKLLSHRRDIFDSYTQACFEQEFTRFFKIQYDHAIAETHRTLYLMVNDSI